MSMFKVYIKNIVIKVLVHIESARLEWLIVFIILLKQIIIIILLKQIFFKQSFKLRFSLDIFFLALIVLKRFYVKFGSPLSSSA